MNKQLLNDFNSVSFEDLGAIPARVNRETNDLYLNNKFWNKIPESVQRYILLHETGHFVLKNDSEALANEYASGRFIREGHFQEDMDQLLRITNLIKSGQAKSFNQLYYSEFPQYKPDSKHSNIAPIVGAALIGGIGSVIGSIFGSSAVSKQAEAIEKESQLSYDIELLRIEENERFQKADNIIREMELIAEQNQIQTYLLVGGLTLLLLIGVYLLKSTILK